MTLAQLSAAEKDAADLTGVQWPFFGYAPGFYMGTCQYCKAVMVGCAKRSTSCFACAIKAASTPRTGQLVAVSDDAVERVARAIQGSYNASDPSEILPWSAISEHERNLYRRDAAAAIAAMKDTQP